MKKIDIEKVFGFITFVSLMCFVWTVNWIFIKIIATIFLTDSLGVFDSLKNKEQ